MSVDHSLTCDGCKHAYWMSPGASVGELRKQARKEGWHVRHGDPDLCPTCLATALSAGESGIFHQVVQDCAEEVTT